MEPVTAAELRAGFVNCSKREAAAIVLPDLGETDWQNLDFLGWRNSRMPQRAYLATRSADRVIGLVLRAAGGRSRTGAMRSAMCELCQTVHSSGGVTLFTAPKAGPAGRRGDSVGSYFCTDLSCCLYVRNRKRPTRVQPETTLTVEERVERLLVTLTGFVDSVLTPTAR